MDYHELVKMMLSLRLWQRTLRDLQMSALLIVADEYKRAHRTSFCICYGTNVCRIWIITNSVV